MVAEPDQAGLFRMRRQRELLQPRPRHIEEPTNVGLGVTAKPSWPGVTRTSPAIFAGRSVCTDGRVKFSHDV